ncbi:MAG: prenyltransferase, partial [Candidatus Eisenbacteria sp.]|nr:prenyltransferase [Candidatus Eisenbacteria bacterium]
MAKRKGNAGREGPAPKADPEIPGRTPASFFEAAGVRYWTVSALAVLVGSTLPFWLRPDGFTFSWVSTIETLVAVVLLHAAVGLARGGTGDAPGAGRPGGGSWTAVAIACGVIAVVIGLHLNAVSPGNLVLVLGIVGIAGGYAYGMPPLLLSHRGLGEVVVGLTLGVLPVVGSYYVQAHVVTWRVLLASLPLAFAAVLVLWANEIAEHDRDEAAGKRTRVVLIGKRSAARVVVPLLSVLIFVSLFAAVFTASHIPLSLVAVLAFGLVRTVVAVFWNHYDTPGALPEAQNAAMKLHLT